MITLRTLLAKIANGSFTHAPTKFTPVYKPTRPRDKHKS